MPEDAQSVEEQWRNVRMRERVGLGGNFAMCSRVWHFVAALAAPDAHATEMPMCSATLRVGRSLTSVRACFSHLLEYVLGRPRAVSEAIQSAPKMQLASTTAVPSARCRTFSGTPRQARQSSPICCGKLEGQGLARSVHVAAPVRPSAVRCSIVRMLLEPQICHITALVSHAHVSVCHYSWPPGALRLQV